MTKISTSPSKMTAEEYKEYQGGITGHFQSWIYCQKLYNDSNRRVLQVERDFKEFLLNAEDREAENTDLLGDYDFDGDLEAYLTM